MIYTIPGQGFAGTRSVYLSSSTSIADATYAGTTDASELADSINTILAVLERFNLTATA